MASLEDLLPSDMSSGDYATVLLAGAAGFVGDAALNLVGFLSPGYVGITAATAALGAKKAAESRWRRRRLVSRANRLVSQLRASGPDKAARDLDRALGLHRQRLVDDEVLASACDDAVARLLNPKE